VKEKGDIVPVRYLCHSLKTNFIKFKEEHSQEQIGYTKFIQSIPKNMKKAKKKTDLCPDCHAGKRLETRYLKMMRQRHRNCSHPPIEEDCNKCKLEIPHNKFPQKFWERLRLEKNRILAYRHHVQRFHHQREKFKKEEQDLKKGEVLLVMDFKENMSLKSAPEETGQDFYYKPQRSVFEVVAIFKGENGKKKHHYFDFFSKCLSHNTHFVDRALKTLFIHPDFTQYNFQKASFWMDNGPAPFKV